MGDDSTDKVVVKEEYRKKITCITIINIPLSVNVAQTFDIYRQHPLSCGQPRHIRISEKHLPAVQHFNNLALLKLRHEVLKTQNYIATKQQHYHYRFSSSLPLRSGRFNQANEGPSNLSYGQLQLVLRTWLALYVQGILHVTQRQKILPLPSSTMMLSSQKTSSVLDVGCGFGKDVLSIYGIMAPRRVAFVDYSSDSLLEAERRWRRFGYCGPAAAFAPADISVGIPPPNELKFHEVRSFATHESLYVERKTQVSATSQSVPRGGDIVPVSSANCGGNNDIHYDIAFCYYVLQHCASYELLISAIYHLRRVVGNHGMIACILPNAHIIRECLRQAATLPTRIFEIGAIDSPNAAFHQPAIRIWQLEEDVVSGFYCFQFGQEDDEHNKKKLDAVPTKTSFERVAGKSMVYHERLVFAEEIFAACDSVDLDIVQHVSLQSFVTPEYIADNPLWQALLDNPPESFSRYRILPRFLSKFAQGIENNDDKVAMGTPHILSFFDFYLMSPKGAGKKTNHDVPQ